MEPMANLTTMPMIRARTTAAKMATAMVRARSLLLIPFPEDLMLLLLLLLAGATHTGTRAVSSVFSSDINRSLHAHSSSLTKELIRALVTLVQISLHGFYLSCLIVIFFTRLKRFIYIFYTGRLNVYFRKIFSFFGSVNSF